MSDPQIIWVKEGNVLNRRPEKFMSSAFEKVKFKNMNSSFIYSFNRYLLSAFYVPGIFLGSGDTRVYKTDKVPFLKELTYRRRVMQ